MDSAETNKPMAQHLCSSSRLTRQINTLFFGNSDLQDMTSLKHLYEMWTQVWVGRTLKASFTQAPLPSLLPPMKEGNETV